MVLDSCINVMVNGLVSHWVSPTPPNIYWETLKRKRAGLGIRNIYYLN